MSSFSITAVSKLTGQTYEVECIDDYFGRHKYGYFVKGSESPLTQREFYDKFEPTGSGSGHE